MSRGQSKKQGTAAGTSKPAAEHGRREFEHNEYEAAWRRIEDLSTQLRIATSPDSPLAQLERAWKQGFIPQAPVFEGRGARIQLASHPLEVISLMLSEGMYPPPELMLAIAEMFERYSSGKGTVSLEEAFFGRPKKNAGNHAARAAANYRDFSIGFHLATLMERTGVSQAKAAEKIAEQWGEDPDSMLRRVNRKWKRAADK